MGDCTEEGANCVVTPSPGSCQTVVDKDVFCSSHVKPYCLDAVAAWNILAVTFNLIPIVVFISIFIYYYIFKTSGAKREKEELKSIFQSLGYKEDGVLYRKIHDFIYS